VRPAVLLGLTCINVAAAGVGVYSLQAERPAVTPDETARAASAPVVVRAEPAAGPQIADRDIEYAALVSEVFNLRGEVEALRAELGNMVASTRSDAADEPDVPGGSAYTAPPAPPDPAQSPAEAFLQASGSGEGLENISTAFMGQAAELVSSSCQGDTCRVSYTLDGNTPAEQRIATLAMSRAIADSVGANVDMVFAREGGESVVYVRRVN
jgi:hypothetical protein